MPPVKTREDPTARRARILDHAVRVIGERGYYGFTVQDLAKACGLSNAGLLHHFPSKEHLFLAALEELEAAETVFMIPLVAAAEREPGSDDARQAAADVLRAIVTRTLGRPRVVRFMAELQVEALGPTHPAHEWFRQRDRVTLELFARLLGPYVDEPASVARQLLAMAEGIALRWLWSERKFDVAAEWERAVTRLAPELVAPAPTGKS